MQRGERMRFDQGQLLERQRARRAIRDPAVVRAMRTVPHERFAPAGPAELAYDETLRSIAANQTISEPHVVALIADALELEPDDKVLEIGTGSGYAAAVLAEVACEVFTIERHITQCTVARERLHALGYRNVQVRCDDGTTGWLEEAPFDAIAVTAGGGPVPPSLRAQLAIGGRLVTPVGKEGVQRLMRVWRMDNTTFEQEDLGAVRFVPLLDAEERPGEAWDREYCMQTHVFLNQVQNRAHLSTLDAAQRATRATLETLAERLGPRESRQLGARLPREIQDYLLTGSPVTERFSSDEFLGRVSEREGVDLQESTHHARAVIEVLGQAVSAVEMIDVLHRLPADYARLFIGSEGQMPHC
jgi:protein-L-isoaspartate(D-aspartate) O-methyltransferase